MEEQVIRYAQPLQVTLTRGQKGTYGWEISARGDNSETIISHIKNIDGQMKEEFPTEAAP